MTELIKQRTSEKQPNYQHPFLNKNYISHYVVCYHEI